MNTKLEYIFRTFWVAAIILCAGTFYFSYYHPPQSTKENMLKEEIKEEFDLIKPLPAATKKSFNLSGDATKATLNADYSARITYHEIYQYYDSKLKKQGWEFVDAKESNPLSGKPDGNKYFHYKKTASKNFTGVKEYTASISYPVLENENGGYNNFSFTLHVRS
ncbi:MAG: hypothetical protein LLG02_08785 [Pelosinus sp.]|nr:hypothetical protein [Pelosinus sp.]